jgi:hypothetical protein
VTTIWMLEEYVDGARAHPLGLFTSAEAAKAAAQLYLTDYYRSNYDEPAPTLVWHQNRVIADAYGTEEVDNVRYYVWPRTLFENAEDILKGVA